MAWKRQKKFHLEGILEILITLPWWFCVLLAVASFFVLHAYSVQPIMPEAVLLHPNVINTDILFKGAFVFLAGIGQYALPAVLGIAALAQLLQNRL